MTSSVLNQLATVNKELWLVFSLLLITLFMNYLIATDEMILGLYTLPTLFSAYFYGRRHAVLTAFASVFVVTLLVHISPFSLTDGGVEGEKWYELMGWGGILVVTAYAMGTMYEHKAAQLGELRETYFGVLMILRQFVSKDKYTQNHSYRVSVYAMKLATCLGLSPERVEDVQAAALLYDIGKLDISRKILYKSSRLTPEEEVGKQVEKGVQMLEPVGGSLRRVIPIVLAHHDNLDGSASPPTQGEEIQLAVQIISLSDAYDSFTSDRPYRKAMAPFEAKDQIIKGKGAEFDSKVVNAFEALFQSGEMEIPEMMV